jgi:hypothetical protein
VQIARQAGPLAEPGRVGPICLHRREEALPILIQHPEHLLADLAGEGLVRLVGLYLDVNAVVI